jgi:hypothetical protein
LRLSFAQLEAALDFAREGDVSGELISRKAVNVTARECLIESQSSGPPPL